MDFLRLNKIKDVRNFDTIPYVPFITRLCAISFLIFLVLKLCGVITWSWWWVTAPIWMPTCIALTLLMLFVCLERNEQQSNKIEKPAQRHHQLTEMLVEREVITHEAEAGELSMDFQQLCRKLAEMVKMYDQMAKQMPAGEAKDLAEDFSDQIITTLSLCDGCTAIINEPTFDAHRHTPVPFSMVEDGTPIQSFLRMGIAINDQVIIPAKIKI